MSSTYHIGDKVRVLPQNTKYGHLFTLTDEMLEIYGGKEVTIDFVSSHIDFNGESFIPNNLQPPCDNYLYGIKEDANKYKWSNTMFTVV